MKKLVGAAALVVLVAAGCSRSNGSCSGAEPATDSVAAEVSSEDVRADSVPAGVRALLASYPDWIKGYSGDSLLMADGTAILYDDGREKDFVTMLDESDPEDMFSMVYREQTPPEYLADAGRSRCEALFKKMYGASAGEVRGHLVDVPWFGQTVKFTSVNGAADSLRAVAAELSARPELRKYLKSSGTFYWRAVRCAAPGARAHIPMALRLMSAWNTPTTGCGRTPGLPRPTAFHMPTVYRTNSWRYSGATALYGAGHGITMTRCTSSSVRRFSVSPPCGNPHGIKRNGTAAEWPCHLCSVA